ncbi:MAG: hypothetical protein CMO81_06130 [Waddliaceae bacterium]|nr:hypothetical protein [Waddliaceae bacterium]
MEGVVRGIGGVLGVVVKNFSFFQPVCPFRQGRERVFNPHPHFPEPCFWDNEPWLGRGLGHHRGSEGYHEGMRV